MGEMGTVKASGLSSAAVREGGDGLRATGFEMQRCLSLRLETGGPSSKSSRRLQEDRLLDGVQ